MKKIHHEIFDYLSILDYIDSAPCYDSQVSLRYHFGIAVYNVVYNKKYIAYDKDTSTWVVTELGYEYRDRLRKDIVSYCKKHNLV